jgi:uncharacterized protein YkwD
MKRFFLFLLLVFALGGGYYLSLPKNAAERGQIATLADRATHQARIGLNKGLAAAGEKLNEEIAPPAPQLAKWEKLLCDLANNERRKRGLSVMQIDPALAAVARAHSREMMQKRYFSHTSPTAALRTVGDRYRAQFHATPRLVAENIYTLQVRGPRVLTEADIRRCHAAWMKSPGHRANILRSTPVSPAHIGVGITAKGGSFWATENFSTPMNNPFP